MRFRFVHLQAAKPGESLLSCEDSWAASDLVGGQKDFCLPANRSVRFVLSDGATTTGYAGLWSHLLVHRVAGGELDLNGPRAAAQINECRERWFSATNQLMADSLPTAKYYAEKLRDRGAAATLALLELEDDRADAGIRFNATVIGDSSIIIHRKERDDVLGDVCLPAEVAALFEKPRFLCSTEQLTPAAESIEQAARCSGVLFPGDAVLMATDALARWYLGENLDLAAARSKRLKLLRELVMNRPREREHRFKRWLNQLRQRQLIEADDVTLLWIELVPSREVAHAE